MTDAGPDWRRTLVRAWLVTGATDFLFSSGLVVLAYHATFASLWQGVASVLLGPAALEGGSRTVLVGLLMHFGVAFAWSAAFVAAFWRSDGLRRTVASRFGVFKVASLYGPAIWMVMSFGVIQALTHRPPNITIRWWVQFFGHIPFVALPIVAIVRRSWRVASPGPGTPA